MTVGGFRRLRNNLHGHVAWIHMTVHQGAPGWGQDEEIEDYALQKN